MYILLTSSRDIQCRHSDDICNNREYKRQSNMKKAFLLLRWCQQCEAITLSK